MLFKLDWEQTSCYLRLRVFILCLKKNAPLELSMLMATSKTDLFG